MYFTRGVGEMQKVRPDGQQESLYRPFFSDVFTSFKPDDFLFYLDALGYQTRAGAQIDALTLKLEGIGPNCVQAMACAGIQGYGGLLAVPYSPDLFSNIIKQGSSPSIEINVQSD